MKITWIDDCILAIKILESLGKRPHLSDIYKVVWQIRHANGRSLPRAWHGTIRHALNAHGWIFSAIPNRTARLGYWTLRKKG